MSVELEEALEELREGEEAPFYLVWGDCSGYRNGSALHRTKSGSGTRPRVFGAQEGSRRSAQASARRVESGKAEGGRSAAVGVGCSGGLVSAGNRSAQPFGGIGRRLEGRVERRLGAGGRRVSARSCRVLPRTERQCSGERRQSADRTFGSGFVQRSDSARGGHRGGSEKPTDQAGSGKRSVDRTEGGRSAQGPGLSGDH